MNEGSIEPSWPVDSTHSGKCDKPATGRGEKEGSVGGRSHHQHYHLTQSFGCLYLTDNQGDFRAQGGGRGGQHWSHVACSCSCQESPQTHFGPHSAPRRSPARRPYKTALCFHLHTSSGFDDREWKNSGLYRNKQGFTSHVSILRSQIALLSEIVVTF